MTVARYGAQFMLRQTYTPLIYAGAQLKVKKAWHTGLGMAYGGFGGLRLQAYSAFRFKRSELLLQRHRSGFLGIAAKVRSPTLPILYLRLLQLQLSDFKRQQ